MHTQTINVPTTDANAALDRIRSLHQPVHRYCDLDGERSWDTVEEAAEALDISPGEVDHFDVCKHCSMVESSLWHLNDEEVPWYLESIWPCATAKAIGIEPSGAH